VSDGLRLPDQIETIPEGLAFWAERMPHAPAVRSVDGPWLTHRELQVAVAHAMAHLRAVGMERGDRVAMVLHGGAPACVALLGTMSMAVAVPFNPAATAHELMRDLRRLQPRLLVMDRQTEAVSRSVARETGVPAIALDELASQDAQRAGQADPPLVTGDSLAAILHTSGTTGLPKRVLRPHRTFVVATRAARQCTDLTPDDVALLPSGLFTNAGLSNMVFALLTGGACVVAPGFDPARFPDWLAAHRPTWTVSTATELNLILDTAARKGPEPIVGPGSRLRAVRVGAQPMTPGTAERAEAALGAPLFEGYGMSEASNIAKSGPGRGDRRAGSCGRPMSGAVTVRVLDASGAEVAPGTTGEIVVRGPTVFPGYLDDADANAAAFLPGGWFRTGDLGSFDADGYLYLHGRTNELINRGGEKIAPAEVDRVLQSHPAVAEAAVFAVPDDRLGEDIVAAVVMRDGLSALPRELRAWMLDRLLPSKVPRRVWRLDALPRTPSGKVRRGELARRWAEDHP
jgi:acyl-CoA synthetase (AMP-forming)/AMP-acid ligase II